jgi:hypothetical protein
VEKPFPGMDPYLETPSLWPDVHHRLITAICDQIQSQIVPRYTALITPYVTFESVEITPARVAVPDVGILDSEPFFPASGAAVAVAPAPLTLPLTVEVPTEYGRIEIRSVRDQLLVTAIELLSPANKRPGLDGADAYEKKRQDIFRSTANLIEIDLLRNGKRPKVGGRLPDDPYFIFLSRAQRRTGIDTWPLSLRDPIKPVPVPLRHPDPDAVLDLGQALNDIYLRARYDVQVDYRQPPPPPVFAPDDAAWLDAQLRERGLRS